MSLTVGYKKALSLPGRKHVIVTLSIPPEARTNVNRRTNVSDRMFAKHRCDRCVVTGIMDPVSGETYPRAISITPPRGARPFIYSVGVALYAQRYDPADWNICSHGIHFFLSYVRALTYQSPFQNDMFQVWYDHGGLRYYGETVGKRFHGLFIEYDHEGRVKKELTVRNDVVQSFWTYEWDNLIRRGREISGIGGRGRFLIKNRNIEKERIGVYLALPALKNFIIFCP